MAGDTVITVIGNLTADPDLRFTQSGKAVAKFTVASTPRKFNKATDAFEEGDTLFLNCSIWDQFAENVTESLSKGTRVIVSGRLVQRSYKTKEEENRTVMELQVDEIGPSLRYATSTVNKMNRTGGTTAKPAALEDEWTTATPTKPAMPAMQTPATAADFDAPPPF